MSPEFSLKARGYFVNTQNVNEISDKISLIYKNQWTNIVFIKAGDWKKEIQSSGSGMNNSTDYAAFDQSYGAHTSDPNCCDACCNSCGSCICSDCDGCGECVIF